VSCGTSGPPGGDNPSFRSAVFVRAEETNDATGTCVWPWHKGERRVAAGFFETPHGREHSVCSVCLEENKGVTGKQRPGKWKKFHAQKQAAKVIVKDLRRIDEQAPNLSALVVQSLQVFNDPQVDSGLDGFFKYCKNEMDAADPGSATRRQYVEMFARMMTANSLSGGAEDVEQMSDDELEAALDYEIDKRQERLAGEFPGDSEIDPDVGNDELVEGE